jgi:hypothetical protein
MNRYTPAAVASLFLGAACAAAPPSSPGYGMPPLDGRVVSAAGQPLAGIRVAAHRALTRQNGQKKLVAGVGFEPTTFGL